jgi:V/A-type H+-transporting ATPase subunit I
MNKVSLVVMEKEKEKALETLRDFGILHVEQKSVQSGVIGKLTEQKARVENVLSLIQGAEESAKKEKLSPKDNGSKDPVGEISALGETRKSLKDEIVSLGLERTRLEKWGDFNPADLTFLAEKGITLIPYELTVKAYEETGAKLIVLSRSKTGVRVAALENEIAGETPFAPGERSLSQVAAELERCRRELAEADKKLCGFIPAKAAVEECRKKILEQLEFETARAGMEKLETGNDAAVTVSWIIGFVPCEKLGMLKRGAAEHGWALLAEEPGPDDNVPTLLKNNRLARLINPLTDFLEVVPGYHEADISGWFLFFFCIFFAMIFGDAGYGALLLLAGIFGITATARRGVPPVFKLLFLLGLSNFAWGILTCSWFGIEDVLSLPRFLQDLSLPLISNVTAARSDFGSAIVRQNLMIFCFTLALLHLSIGHIIAITRTRSLKLLADLGSIAMLFGMYCIVLSLIASNEARAIPLFQPAPFIFGAGFVLNFIFAGYDGSIGLSVLESFKNIISMVLGVANVFSDIMSYIRLWAVGLAGAAIANTVNQMAGGMMGHLALFVFGILLLFFGHGLNLVLNVLSVLVHGVRLNTLEFSGHVGLTWSGYAYKPFAKRVK